MKYADEIVRRTGTCAYCPNLCLHACPVATAEGNDAVTPWGKMSLARWLASGKAVPQRDTVEALYHCTGCGACRDACRHRIDVATTLGLAREAAVQLGVGPFPDSAFAPPSERPSDRILPPGVSGHRLFDAGFADVFTAIAQAAAGRWRQRSELVFASAQDARCVREVYPRHGIEVTAPVSIASEVPGAAAGEPVEGPVAYFEACAIARGQGARPEAVLANARALGGGALIVLRWTGESATCCGAGATYPVASPSGARAAAERILDNAILRGAKTLLVGCAGCAAHLEASLAGRALAVRAIGSRPA